MSKPRIAVLGGGTGAVTAALQLSKPGWKQHFQSITLYQQGWRLGGKGASGRGTDLRIEEHGLHLWFGFYENAFALLHRCHRELDKRAGKGTPRWDIPFKNMEDSFSAINDLGVTDFDGCGWSLWTADFFEDDGDHPWDPREGLPDEWSPVDFIERCLRLAADGAYSLVESDPALAFAIDPVEDVREALDDLDDALDAFLAALTGDVRRTLDAAADLVDKLIEEGFDEPTLLHVLGFVLQALDIALEFLRRRSDALARASPTVRRAYYVVDLMVAIARGLIDDGVVETDSFAVIDDIDLRHWLLAHGASLESVDSALIRGVVYDLGFAYEDGNPQRPSCGAGTALYGLLRAFFTYRGSLMWRMNSAMGDTVFLPFYELLIKRDVKIRFFHQVEAIKVAGGVVEEITIDVQAKPQNATPEKFVTVGGIMAWPAEPNPDLVAPPPDGPPAAAYESWFMGRDAARAETKVLKRSKGDFDLVVFGLPVSCVPYVAPELIAGSGRWQAAVRHLRTVPTQAMQLWLKHPAKELAAVHQGIVVSGYVEPFDTWADMFQVVEQENVPGSKTVAYFCNVLADAPPPVPGAAGAAWLQQQAALVRHQALRFLRLDIAELWPKAVDSATGALDWDLLIDPTNRQGDKRLDAQYLRANVEPSERYVLSVPGSSKHRFAPYNTDFRNLYAVGDWTACGINAGCVEAAVISGMLAANAIHRQHGDPGDAEPIIGFPRLMEGDGHGG